jgi:anaerobic selenocysteine-containing dehydrogenase
VESPDATYPFVLTTGRVKNHWHSRTRTGHVEVFNRRNPEPFVEMHPDDARRLGIQDADFVAVVGRRGKVIAQARVTAEIRPGTCFIPFHWGRQAGFYKAANNLTLRAVDPVSRQPELKHAAVAISKIIDVEFPD